MNCNFSFNLLSAKPTTNLPELGLQCQCTHSELRGHGQICNTPQWFRNHAASFLGTLFSRECFFSPESWNQTCLPMFRSRCLILTLLSPFPLHQQPQFQSEMFQKSVQTPLRSHCVCVCVSRWISPASAANLLVSPHNNDETV